MIYLHLHFIYNFLFKSIKKTKIPHTSWSDWVGSNVSQKLSSQERMRQEAIYELINTEQIYYTDIDMTIEVFFFF